MITGIVVALPEEINSLTSKKIDKGCFLALTENILLAYAGAGIANAEKASRLLLSQGAEALISWGCAAALDPNLKPGDLTVAGQLIDADGQSIDIESDWRQQTIALLQQYSPIFSGVLVESRDIVAKQQEKAAIFNRCQALALDMESCAVAKTAIQASKPFLAIRAIADPADMSLPDAVSYAMNAEGDVVITRLLRFLLTHPQQLPGLIKLGLHFNAATNKLKLVAQHLDTISSFSSIKE